MSSWGLAKSHNNRNNRTLLLMFGHSTKSQSVTSHHLPHAIVIRLHIHEVDVAILTSKATMRSRFLSSNPSLSVGFPTRNEAMDVARSTPQRTPYHADVSYWLPLLGMKNGAWGLWYSRLGLHQLGSQPSFFMLRWANHFGILYQVGFELTF